VGLSDGNLIYPCQMLQTVSIFSAAHGKVLHIAVANDYILNIKPQQFWNQRICSLLFVSFYYT